MKNKENLRVGGQVMRNCFLSVADPIGVSVEGEKSASKYLELQRSVTSDGVKEEYVEVDYPITEEYVNSFVDGADYHADPLSKVRLNCRNLGDIVDMQNLTAQDMESARCAYEKLRSVFDKLKIKQNTPKEEEK